MYINCSDIEKHYSALQDSCPGQTRQQAARDVIKQTVCLCWRQPNLIKRLKVTAHFTHSSTVDQMKDQTLMFSEVGE